ncbi:uncharacterized protein BDV17DRAFT_294066 [Aspergillus undulatus]|uniref:uncharacterized protein n=1 Tax=Aspergillus undulatus TaxID=1810928 RepID=UPI003CCD3B94
MAYCDVSHSVPVEFEDVPKLVLHLQSEHGDQLTKSKIQGRARRNRRIATRDPFVCPLCDAIPNEIRTIVEQKPYQLLSEHIAEHLKSLAFLSLSYVEGNQESSYDLQNSEEMYCFTGSSEDIEQESAHRDAPHSHQAIPFLDDIPVTEIIADGKRRVDNQVLSGPSTPLLIPEDWAFIPTINFPTDFEALQGHLNGILPISGVEYRDEGDHPTVSRLTHAPWNEKLTASVEEAYQLQNKTPLSRHSDYHAIAAGLAYAYWCQGQFKKAERVQTEELELCTKHLGKEHPSTLTSENNQACIIWSVGRWREAEAQFQRVAELRSQIWGKDHISTLTSMSNLASTHGSLGAWSKACALGREVADIQSTQLGPKHSSTLVSMSNIATALWNQGELEEAERMEKAVLATRESVLGRRHPDTLNILNNLACTYQSQKRWAEAEELGIEVLKSSQEILGPNHPFTLTAMGNLAHTHRKQGRAQKAKELETRVLETQERILGAEHPDTLLTLWNLASTMWQQTRYPEAIAMLRRCVLSQTAKLGPDHPHTAAARKDLKRWLSPTRGRKRKYDGNAGAGLGPYPLVLGLNQSR